MKTNSLEVFKRVHRDLHSGNILQYYRSRVCIGDLGLCQPTTRGKDAKEKKIYGVIPYIPPEVLRGEKFTLPRITSPLIPPCISEIIVKCWDINPENRPAAEQVKKELWEASIDD
ncbi:hypothetical protein G9A89_017876 [Geosiphon pyriformis]|nr:hypothetical protein G9A89_017876 [Geosiphon pyriformis]